MHRVSSARRPTDTKISLAVQNEVSLQQSRKKNRRFSRKVAHWKLVDFKLHPGNLILRTLIFLKLNYYYHFLNKVTRITCDSYNL